MHSASSSDNTVIPAECRHAHPEVRTRRIQNRLSLWARGSRGWLLRNNRDACSATTGTLASQSVPNWCLAELTPYCGIMKVGGYALQQNGGDRKLASLGHERNGAFHPDLPDFPGGSQSSTISTLSTDSMPPVPQTVNPQKRRLEDNSEYEIGESSFSPFICEDLTPPPAPFPTCPVSHISVTNINVSRPLARPRARRRAHQIAILRTAKPCVGNEENMDAGAGGAPTAQCGDDFDEADFLLPHSWAAAEAEMTGV